MKPIPTTPCSKYIIHDILEATLVLTWICGKIKIQSILELTPPDVACFILTQLSVPDDDRAIDNHYSLITEDQRRRRSTTGLHTKLSLEPLYIFRSDSIVKELKAAISLQVLVEDDRLDKISDHEWLMWPMHKGTGGADNTIHSSSPSCRSINKYVIISS